MLAHVPAAGARPRRSWPQRLVIALLVGVISCCLLGATGIGYGVWKFDQIHRDKLALSGAADGQPLNYLVVGSDSRDALATNDPNGAAFGASPGQRSDTIIVVRVDPHNQRLTMLSLPRDLWVPIAGQSSKDRINTAYGLGKQTLVDTITRVFHVPVNHYIEVNFKGFEGLVNTIDGVPMYFDSPMHDPKSGLEINEAGCSTLDGSQALAFARSRDLSYTDRQGDTTVDGTGDLGRIARQQHFVKRALKRATGQALSNPATLRRLIDVGVENVSIDKGLSLGDLTGLANRFRSYDANDLTTFSLPVIPFTTAGGAQVLRLDDAAAQPVLDRFRDPLPPLTEADVHLTVLNGSNHATQGPDAAGALQRTGVHLTRWGNGSEIGLGLIPHSQIRYGADAQPAADLVARHLSTGADLVSDPKLAPGDVVLITGSDFARITGAARPKGAPAPDAITTRPGSPSSLASTTTTTIPGDGAVITTPIGHVPGDPPPGVSC